MHGMVHRLSKNVVVCGDLHAIVYLLKMGSEKCKCQTHLRQAILHVVAYLYYTFQVVEEKELEIAQMENKKLLEQETAEKAAEKLAEKEPECSTYPRKDSWQSVLEIPEILFA